MSFGSLRLLKSATVHWRVGRLRWADFNRADGFRCAPYGWRDHQVGARGSAVRANDSVCPARPPDTPDAVVGRRQKTPQTFRGGACVWMFRLAQPGAIKPSSLACRVAAPWHWSYSRMPQSHAHPPSWSRQSHGVPNASSARVRKRHGADARRAGQPASGAKVGRTPVRHAIGSTAPKHRVLARVPNHTGRLPPGALPAGVTTSASKIVWCE